MGTKISNATETQSKALKEPSQDVFSRMNQRVLLSQEELYSRHHADNKGSLENNVEIEMSLYYKFMKAGHATQQPKEKSGEYFTLRSCTRNTEKRPSVSNFESTRSRHNNNSMRSKAVKARYVKRKELTPERSVNISGGAEEKPAVHLCHSTPRLIPLMKKFPGLSSTQRNSTKEPLPNFDKVSLLPANIFMTILSYSMDNFKNIIAVNPSWYSTSNSALNTYFNKAENSFVNAYGTVLLFKDSYNYSSPMKFCGISAIKVDRVFRCENLERTAGKTLIISFKYRYFDGTGNEYICEYMYDSVHRQPTIVWLQRNSTELRTDTSLDVSVQPVVTVCEGDSVEFAVPFYSLRGLIDVRSIQWLPPRLIKTPKENIMNYHRDKKLVKQSDKTTKLIADLGKISEFEDSQVVWRCIEDRTAGVKALQLEDAKRCFEFTSLEYSHVDIYVAKITLRAHTQGRIKAETFGIPVVVRRECEDCTREVKRVGLTIERQIDLELRIGDILIVYISK
eukprot:TRINITY_DN12690_c0_g2_i4.p1 TRINITY_DN12690_c0_g2~~TRINITY_DN12690_c0_g2_i4.p1  ORF type:complete len:556 (+),score=135.41 TRINITY_DN12690_c0_g2_i4:147-1670(+)